MGKRIFSAILIFVLCLSVSTAVLAAASEGVAYVDADGVSHTADGVTQVTAETVTWESGWYVVTGAVTVGGQDDRVEVSGDVDLILADGGSLIAQGGIHVPEGSSLTVWAQKDGSGALTATALHDYCAGIGGTSGSNGPITINGGVVEARGGSSHGGGSAAIGGGKNYDGGDITINGGTVTAYGGDDAAGIGGGMSGDGTNIAVHGGTVTTYGSGAGIGGGAYGGNGSDITITGGTVMAVAWNGPGIGGSDGSDITISGGTVTAIGHNGGAGIGGGWGGAGRNITISGGTVTADGNGELNRGSGIGGGYHGTTSGITITGGTVTAQSGIDSSPAIGAAPEFDGYDHETYGNAEDSTESDTLVEWTGNPSSDWPWLWVRIQAVGNNDPAPTPEATQTPEDTVPQTGDGEVVWPWVLLMAVSLGELVFLAVLVRRGKER